MSDTAVARHQQRVEELCAAAIRALSGQAEIRFRGGRLHRGGARLPLGALHLHPDTATDDFGSFRGVADGVALRLRHCDQEVHAAWCPRDPIARMVFELLEQFRVETLVDAAMPGVTANLAHRHREWSLTFHRSGLTESAHGLLLYTVVQVCRSQLTGRPVVDETQDLIESTRFALSGRLGDDLAGLRRHRRDQARYAVLALSIATTVAEMMADGTDDDGRAAGSRRSAARARFTLLVDQDQDRDGEDGVPVAASSRSAVLAGAAVGYEAFTRAYDDQHDATSLVRAAQLRSYREELDQQIADHDVNIARLARQLRALLAEPRTDGWDNGLEQGRIDGRRLTQLITSPRERRLFRAERTDPLPSALVTFLVDCSGSMKRHAASVAMLVDVFARALERAGVSSEVLGFTTGAWNGGRARQDWLRAGCPTHPGRLNEVRHLVFKDAGSTWRRARPGIAALLQPDMYREGVDGEAVTWALARGARREEHRKLLVVISDGSPMDSATIVANDAHYLEHHLREIVARAEGDGLVEVYGVGVGLDLSPYYSHSRVLDLSQATSNAMFGEVVDLIARAGHR